MDTIPDRRTIGLGVVLAAASLVLASSVLLIGRAGEAQAVSVDVGEDAITVHVRDVIEDPDAVLEVLRSAGVAATIERVAAPSELDGVVVSAGTIGGDIATTSDDDGDGAIDRIVVGPGFGGSLVLGIGDPDAPVGAVTVAAAPAACRELLDRVVAAVEAELATLGGEVRWSRAHRTSSGQIRVDAVDRGAVADDEVVVEVLVGGDGVVLVTVSPTPDALPPPASDPCVTGSAR